MTLTRAGSVCVKMPADGAAREIGVAQRMYDRELLFDRELAPSEGVTRQVG
jgi:hypothetical protein